MEGSKACETPGEPLLKVFKNDDLGNKAPRIQVLNLETRDAADLAELELAYVQGQEFPRYLESQDVGMKIPFAARRHRAGSRRHLRTQPPSIVAKFAEVQEKPQYLMNIFRALLSMECVSNPMLNNGYTIACFRATIPWSEMKDDNR